MRLSYEDCTKKGLWTLEDRTIGGKLYKNVKVYHFGVCKNCKEHCNGRIHYGAVKKAMKGGNYEVRTNACRPR